MTDLSNHPFLPVTKAGEIPAGEGRTFEVAGRLVAVFFDGRDYHAMDDLCPHMGASLGCLTSPPEAVTSGPSRPSSAAMGRTSR